MSESIRISKGERDSLEAMTKELGTTGAAKALEVSVPTLARAIAGLGVQRATITHLRSKLLSSPRTIA